MPEPKISPYKLSRDLEEKAKETKRRKELLDKIIPQYEKIIKYFEKWINEEIIKKFSEVKKLYDEKEFYNAWEIFSSLKKDIDSITKSAMREKISDLEFILSCKIKNLDEFKKKLSNIPENPEEFIKFYDEILENVKLKIKDGLSSIEPKELSSEIFKKYGNEISSIENMDIDSLKMLCNEISRIEKSYFMERLNNLTEKLDYLRDSYSSLKISISSFNTLNDEVIALIKDEKYFEAMEKMKNFISNSENTLSEILKQVLDNIEKSINELKSLNVDLDQILENISVSREMLSKGEYKKLIELIKNINASIEKSKVVILEKKINEVKEKIQSAKENNLDMEEITKVFERMRELINKRQLKEALKSFDEIIYNIDEMERKRENVIKEIDEMISNFQILKALDLPINIGDLEKIKKNALSNPNVAERDLENYRNIILNNFEKGKEKILVFIEKIISSLNKIYINIQFDQKIFSSKDISDFSNSFNNFIKDVEKTLLNYVDSLFPEDNSIKNALSNFLENLKNYDLEKSIASLEVFKSMVLEHMDVSLNKKFDEIKEISKILFPLGLDINSVISDVEKFIESNASYEEKIKILKDLYDIVVKVLSDLELIYIKFVDSAINIFTSNNIKVQDEILNQRKNVEGLTNFFDRLKNLGYIDSLVFNTFVKIIIILAQVDLLDKKFGIYMKELKNEINFLRKDLEDLKYNEIKEEFEKLLKNIDLEGTKNGFNVLKNMVSYINDIKTKTGLYENVIIPTEINTTDRMSLLKLYQDLDHTIDDFRHHIFSEIANVSDKKIVKEIFSKEFSEIIEDYITQNYLSAWLKVNTLSKNLSLYREKYDEAKKLLNSLERNIIIFENLGFKFEKSREIIENLRNMLENTDFDGFFETYREKYLDVKNEIYNVLNSYLISVEEKVISYKGKKNTLIADGLITSAKRAIKLSNFEETVKYLFDALEDIQADDIIKNISSNLMQRVKKLVEIFGIIKPKDLMESITKANLYINQGKYSNAIFELNSILLKYEEMSNKINEIKLLIEEIKEKINVSVILGINVQQHLKDYQAARMQFQTGQIEKSIELLINMKRKLDIEIEEIVGKSLIALIRITELSKYLKVDFEIDYTNLKEKSTKIISILLLKKEDSLTKVIQEFKNESEKIISSMSKIEKKLKDNLNILKLISINNGFTEFNDDEFLYQLWLNKQYHMLEDLLPFVEIKVMKFYVQSFSNYMEKNVQEIIKDIHYVPSVEKGMGEIFSLFSSVGNLDPLNSRDNINSYAKKIKMDGMKNLEEKYGIKTFDNDLTYIFFNSLATKIIDSYSSLVLNFYEFKANEINSTAENIGMKINIPELKEIKISNALKIIEELSNELGENLKKFKHYSNIDLNVVSDGEKAEGKITLEYLGIENVKNLVLKLEGSLMETFQIGPMNKNEKKDLQFKSKIMDDNRILLTLDYDGEIKQKEVNANLKIERGFTVKKATGNERCALCKGKIFNNLEMAICNKCGAMYHYQCAKRAGKCVSCGNKFDFSEKNELEVKVSL
ncbi:MAG: RING finger protein [Thermoplasmata archaeon]